MRDKPQRFLVLRLADRHPGIEGSSPFWQSVAQFDSLESARAWLGGQYPKTFTNPSLYAIAIVEGEYEVAAQIEARKMS